MVTFVTVSEDFIVNVFGFASAYPSGALVSIRVYSSPSTSFLLFSSSTTCSVVSDVHLSINSLFLFRISSSAPFNPCPFPSTFMILNLIVLSSIRTSTTLLASIVNVLSSAFLYPLGAFNSFNVYVFPAVRPSITCACPSVVQEAPICLSPSNIASSAPGTPLPFSSTFRICTPVFWSTIISTLPVSSSCPPLTTSIVRTPSFLIVKIIGLASAYPSGAFVSSRIYVLPATSLPVIV